MPDDDPQLKGQTAEGESPAQEVESQPREGVDIEVDKTAVVGEVEQLAVEARQFVSDHQGELGAEDVVVEMEQVVEDARGLKKNFLQRWREILGEKKEKRAQKKQEKETRDLRRVFEKKIWLFKFPDKIENVDANYLQTKLDAFLSAYKDLKDRGQEFDGMEADSQLFSMVKKVMQEFLKRDDFGLAIELYYKCPDDVLLHGLVREIGDYLTKGFELIYKKKKSEFDSPEDYQKEMGNAKIDFFRKKLLDYPDLFAKVCSDSMSQFSSTERLELFRKVAQVPNRDAILIEFDPDKIDIGDISETDKNRLFFAFLKYKRYDPIFKNLLFFEQEIKNIPEEERLVLFM